LTTLVGSWSGEEEFREIVNAIERRHRPQDHGVLSPQWEEVPVDDSTLHTPPESQNREPPVPETPRIPSNGRFPIPALVSGHDAVTPTPTPGGHVSMVPLS
jgi:tRNA-dihydrouridine synthase 2